MKYISILTAHFTLLLKARLCIGNTSIKNRGRYLRVLNQLDPIESLNQTHMEDKHVFQEKIILLNDTHTDAMNSLHNQIVQQNFTHSEQIGELKGKIFHLRESNLTLHQKINDLEQKNVEHVESLERMNQHLTDQVLALQQQIEGIHNLLHNVQNPSQDPNAPKLVFLSSGEYSGDSLSGSIENADSICQELADAENLPGTYKAWLSISSTGESPSTSFTHSEHGYVLVDETTMVADNWNDLIDGTLLNPINKNEKGEEVGSASVWSSAWTFTNIDGTHNEDDCSSDWGRIGHYHTVDSSWTESMIGSCNGLKPIYCFQQ